MINSFSSRIISGVLWNFFGQIWMAILAFFAMPFIVRSLNVSLYGIYSLVGVIIGYFSFLQFGLGNASVKYIAQYLAAKEEDKARRAFWSSLYACFFLGIAGVVLIMCFSRILAERFLNIAPDILERCVYVFRLGSVGFLSALMLGAVTSAIQATGRFDILNRIGILVGSLQIILAITALKLGLSLEGVVVSGVFVQVLGFFLYGLSVKKNLPFLARPCLDIGALVTLFKFGGFVTISAVVGPVLLNIEKVFLTSIGSLASLTYYFIPFSLIDRLSMVRSSFSAVLFPAFSYLEGSSGNANKQIHLESTSFICSIYLFFVCFFAIFAKPFLAAWMGEEFARQSGNILFILSLGGLVNAMAAPSLAALQGFGKPHLPALFHIIETVLYVPLCFFLIHKYKGTGAAAAWFLRVFLDMFFLHCAACKYLKENIFLFYAKIIVKNSISFFVCILLFVALRRLNLSFFSVHNIGAIFIIFIIYCAGVWALGLGLEAKKRIRNFLGGIAYGK